MTAQHINQTALHGFPAILAAVTLLGAAGAGHAQDFTSSAHDFRLTTVAAGLEHPWGLVFLPDGDLLVTERPGRLRRISDGRLVDAPIAGVPQVVARGQGGLLDVALHPRFADNRLVYLSYAGAGPGGVGTEVARARLAGDRLEDRRVIFRASPKAGGGVHFGGRLLFAPDGTLMVTLGDRGGHSDQAQTPANHLGTIVRIGDDGSVPADNPFAGRDDASGEVYSFGHRNVQGIALRPGTEEIWAHEHGPRGGDELNRLRPGANYGWPAITYGIDYSGAVISELTALPGMEQPVIHWTPSIAPSGMAFYDGDRFPNWRGDLFVGALAHRHLRRLTLDGDQVTGQEVLLEGLGERIRAVAAGPDGLIYVLTDNPQGRVLQLEPAE